MSDFIKLVLSLLQKTGSFIKNAWESVYSYGRYLMAWFAPKPYGFEEALNTVRSNDPLMTHLDLHNMGLSYLNIIELAYALERNTTLSSLDLSGCQLTIASIQELIPKIISTSLNISDNQIGDAGAQALAANTMLTSLNVSNNQIGDAGAQALAANTMLTFLNVSNNQIGDAGAQALAANTMLTSLNVSNNQIGTVGGLAITTNSTLRFLWIDNNIFLPGSFDALSNILNNHFSLVSSTLTFLDIRGDNQLHPSLRPIPLNPYPNLLMRSEVRAHWQGIYRTANAFSSIVNKSKDNMWLSANISFFLTKRSVNSIITRAEKSDLRINKSLPQQVAATEELTSAELTDGANLLSL